MARNINVESVLGLTVASLCMIMALWIGTSPDPPEMLCEDTGAVNINYMQICGLIVFAFTTINLTMVGSRAIAEFL
jgi:hypothetical protein